MSALWTGQMSASETEEMSSVETGWMSAVETRQMSAPETGQMSSVARAEDICLSAHNVQVSEASTLPMLKSQKSQLSQYHNFQISEVSIVPILQCSSLRNLNCPNITMFKSQKSQLWQCHNVQVSESRSGPKSSKMVRNGSRMVARSRACHGHVLASGTGPAAQNPAKMARNPKSASPGGGSRVRLLRLSFSSSSLSCLNAIYHGICRSCLSMGSGLVIETFYIKHHVI